MAEELENPQPPAEPKKPRKPRGPRKKKLPPPKPTLREWLRTHRQLALLRAVEAGALLIAGLIATMAALGMAASRFGGTGLWTHLIPFATAVLVLAVLFSLFLWLWFRARPWMLRHQALLPALTAVGIAAGALWYSSDSRFGGDVNNLRTLVGGVAEAERATVAHQVYANYRRSDLKSLEKIVQRAEVYRDLIEEAGRAYGVDSEILVGIGAAESSFYPRDSKDGGKGLFQITAAPKIAMEQVRKTLQQDDLDMLNQRHNTYVAAATFRHYLGEMKGDLFLGLLAYNIGPKNGGLRSIVEQYGVKDFVTIQPYLQNLPRDYPIRVLTASLAYRLWRYEGKLPRYEESDNALRIQRLGIPGLQEATGTASGTATGSRDRS
ncbi:MAG: transglycosylase [Methylococcaceae bacterium]|nr:transglycosylase [Methylococcaceae bacterium]